jgi:hypothetical protein
MYPPEFRVPEFVKFTGKDNRTTWEHVSQFLAQMGEASSSDYLKVRLFPCHCLALLFHDFLLYHRVLFLHGHI